MGKDIGTLTFDTFNDLRKASGSQSSTVTVLGKDTINDLDGGRFYWDATSTDADDNQNILQKTGLNPGRWVRFVGYTENFGNTNLTLTSDRNLNGNSHGLVFSNLSDLNLYANNIGFTSQVSNTFTFSGPVGLFTFDTSLLSGASKNIQIPNTTGVIALQSYVTSSTASTLSSANAYTDTQISAVNTSLNGYIKRETAVTYADVNTSGPEAIIVVQTDENNSGNRGLYYRNTGKIDWIIAQPFNY